MDILPSERSLALPRLLLRLAAKLLFRAEEMCVLLSVILTNFNLPVQILKDISVTPRTHKSLKGLLSPLTLNFILCQN